MILTDFQLRPLLEMALREDIRSGDITTQSLILPTHVARAKMVFRASGIVCGLDVAALTFKMLDEDAQVQCSHSDGDKIEGHEAVLQVEGNARAILTAERVALNFAQRMSGIATLTAQFVEAISGTNARLADTRKTTPGLRLIEKYAVRCGGGSNHRFALDDLILIKDNHIALCGSIREAVARARKNGGHAVKIEVECDTLSQVQEALDAAADIILLDNMSPDALSMAVDLVAGRALCEASGGINLNTARAVAQSGVDILSVGALTHGAKSVDIGLDIEVEV